MIPIKKLNELVETIFLIKKYYNVYVNSKDKDDHVFIAIVRKLANDLLNWCEDCEIGRW